MCKNIKDEIEIKNIDYEKLAERLYSLYVVRDFPWIRQNEDGTYKYIYDEGNLKENKNILERHLQGLTTVGVFCHSHSKFVCLDVDFASDKILGKWITRKIVNILEEDFGFDSKYVNVSFSGSKGYHILIFFDDIVSFKQIQYLYDLVLEQMYYTIDYNLLKVMKSKWNYTLEQLKHKIELRPQPNLGVKLELSIHQVTKNKCWFCDNQTLEPIEDMNYLYEIQQAPRDYIQYALDYGKEIRSDRNAITYFNDEIKSRVKPANSQKLYTDKAFTIEYVEDLINNGLQIEGSRHNSLMKIARYYYHFGYSDEENINMLEEWMSKQNKSYYKSSEMEYVKDIESIVKYVSDNCRGISGVVRDITINKDEMMEILKHKEKCKKLLFYAFVIHAKRYATKGNQENFYMTYSQILESTHINKRSLIKYLKQLEDDGEIEVIRRNEFRKGSCLKLPNKYIIKNKIINTNSNDSTYTVKRDKDNLKIEYDNSMVNLFTKKELRSKLTYTQYIEVYKLYVA